MQENPYATPPAFDDLPASEAPNLNPYGPSLTLFRGMVGLSLWCYLASLSLPQLGLFPYPQEMYDALQLNNYGALLPPWLIMLYTAVLDICSLVGMVGLFFFWRASRWILAIAVLLTFLSTPLMGLSVSTPFEPIVGQIAILGMIWLVTVSFWSPLAEKFRVWPYQQQPPLS